MRAAIRLVKYHSLGLVLLFAMLLLWWAGTKYLERGRKPGNRPTSEYSPPLKSVPPPSKSNRNNNATSALGLPRDLDGTAILYPEQVNDLVNPDGSFRTDLPLLELARILNIDPGTIASKGSSVEIDPDAVLFRAVAGRLTESAKAESQYARKTQIQTGLHPSAVVDGWEKTTLNFSLNALIRPSDSLKPVLDAISRSARTIMQKPGPKVNAVPVTHERELDAPVFHGGDLPLESPRSETEMQ